MKRNNAIESVRYIAAFAVICIHFFPATGNIKIIVDQWARFAVPFFFVISGYFLAEKLRNNDKLLVYLNYIKKILFLYLVWQLIYFLNPPLNEIHSQGFFTAYINKFTALFKHNLEYIIFNGWGHHLWFFASLILTVLFFLLFRLKRVNLMLGIAVLLYIFGVLARTYSKTTIGIDVNFNSRNFIFLSALPFSFGVFFSVRSVQIKLTQSILILIAAYALHYTEIWYLGYKHLSRTIDYGIFTFLLGVGTFLVAKNRFSPLKIEWIARLGKYSLGIYSIHILICHYINQYVYKEFANIPAIVFSLFILIISTLIAILLSQIPYIKKMVS